MLSVTAGIVILANAGLGVAIAAGPRGNRVFWLVFGVQVVATALGIWSASPSGEFAWWNTATQSTAAFIVCVVGPVGLTTAAAGKALTRVMSSRNPSSSGQVPEG